jgi:hypothetical protein
MCVCICKSLCMSTYPSQIYARTGTTWSQQGGKLVATGLIGGGGRNNQGTSVALNAAGDYALVGAQYEATGGAVWVFTRTGTTWSQSAKLVGSNRVGVARQGSSVALNAAGDFAMVGGWSDDSSAGAVWFFSRTSTTWSQEGAKLLAQTGGNAQQGKSVSLDDNGDFALVGGYAADDDIAATWVYDITPTLAPTMLPTTLAPTMAPTTLAPTMPPTTLTPTMVPTTTPTTAAPTTAGTSSVVAGFAGWVVMFVIAGLF